MIAARDYGHGPQRLADGRVRFRLWAPGARGVRLHVEEQVMDMEPLPAGWFERACVCPAGARYAFEPLGVGRVPDPASQLQACDVESASVVVDHGQWHWKHNTWQGRPWHEVVLIEVHVGLLGGFDGVRRRLAEWAALGITAIELMPIADFPGPRNWGYDGVLPYAPDRSYGTPDELKALIDDAHGLGLMVFLDVVYNHFGPVGNALHAYAPQFFRDDVQTPWGPAIDFRQAPVRDYFAGNTLYWLQEYRFDGLRFDAVHAIVEKEDWLEEMAGQLRQALPPDRYVHLVLENDDNTASLLRGGFNAQWNDDAHHVIHHLLTGESRGYYGAYVERPTHKLARALAEGFVYQGEPSVAHGGAPRGQPSAMLPPTAFVFFLQNHDQIGNRALGERLLTLCGEEGEGPLRAAVALQLLCPAVPLLFMGEEQGARTPFLYFTSFPDPEFAQKVKQGRRAEFADFHEGPVDVIPDPNAVETYERSRLADPADEVARRWRGFYAELLALRHTHVVPGLKTASCEGVVVLGDGCVLGRWALGTGSSLLIACNLSGAPIKVAAREFDDAVFLHESRPGAAGELEAGMLPGWSTVAALCLPHAFETTGVS